MNLCRPEKQIGHGPIQRDEIFYLDLSGRIEEPSVVHNYQLMMILFIIKFYMAAIKSSGFAVVTGLTYKSRCLVLRFLKYSPDWGERRKGCKLMERAT